MATKVPMAKNVPMPTKVPMATKFQWQPKLPKDPKVQNEQNVLPSVLASNVIWACVPWTQIITKYLPGATVC